MLQEKQFFLKCLEEGPLCQRKIANRMSSRFNTSPAAVKDALLREGLIELAYIKREGATQKLNHYFKLTKKKLKQVEQIEVKVKIEDAWEDGTPKSKGNAFDWGNTAKGMFDNREAARMTQKYHQNKPITIYSRA